jgi:uncharacterized repeat protein (TIGR02543 family)
MSANRTVTATFTQNSYTLSVSRIGSGTVTSSPAGINCGSTCSQNYTSGTSVSLSVTAASGYSFSGWSGACSGTGTCTVAMSATRTVTATFSQNVSSAASYLVSWDPLSDSNITGYKIYYSTGAYSSSSTLHTINVDAASSTSYLIDPATLGITTGTTVNVFVSAVGNGMESPLSDMVTVVLQ